MGRLLRCSSVTYLRTVALGGLLKERWDPQFLSSFFQSPWRELDVIEDVEHEVIDRHGVPRLTLFWQDFLAPGAVKNGLYNRPGFRTRSVQQRNSIGVILDRCPAVVAAKLRAQMAFVVYLKYKRHKVTLRKLVRSASAMHDASREAKF
jgi:hypothetical protein